MRTAIGTILRSCADILDQGLRYIPRRVVKTLSYGSDVDSVVVYWSYEACFHDHGLVHFLMHVCQVQLLLQYDTSKALLQRYTGKMINTLLSSLPKSGEDGDRS